MKHIIIEIIFAIDFFCDRIIAPKITCAPRTSVSDFSVFMARNARSVFITKLELRLEPKVNCKLTFTFVDPRRSRIEDIDVSDPD